MSDYDDDDFDDFEDDENDNTGNKGQKKAGAPLHSQYGYASPNKPSPAKSGKPLIAVASKASAKPSAAGSKPIWMQNQAQKKSG